MVLPLIIGALGSAAGAAGSIFSAMSGAKAQREANQMNWLINLYNQQKRDKERREGMEYAEKLRGEGKLGAIDAQGTRTYYKEGVGWVTELGPRPRELEDYFYGQELPELRDKFKRDVMRGRETEDVAGQLLAEFKRVAKEDPKAVEDLLYSIQTRGIGQAANEVLEPAMRDALRAGGATTGLISGEVAKQGMEARRRAAQDAKLQALDYTQGKYEAQRGGLSQLYKMFADEAAEPLVPSMQPGAGPAAATSLMNQFSQAAQSGASAGANAIARQGGTLAPREADMSTANMWGGIGQSVAGLGERLSAMGEREQQNRMLQNYITQGGQLSLNQGGIMDLMTQRIRAGGGIY